jgi:carbon-monoxide dehydrogenase medium subunit
VIPAAFGYHRATSVADALDLLTRFGDDGKVLAGGHSLIPMMKLRFARPAELIDIARIAELTGINAGADEVRIGATTRHAEVASSTVVARLLPALADAANQLGDVQVRNRGTMIFSATCSIPISPRVNC